VVGIVKLSNRGFIGWQGGLLLAVLGGAIVASAIFGFRAFQKSENVQVVPADIKQKISHVIYYPDTIGGLTVDKTSFKYDDTNEVLSYTAKYSSAEITIAEQSTPENFVDIPQAYDKLVETLNSYSAFSSFHGTVYLTKPKENKGQQSAVMNSKGTLMFANVTIGSLTDNEWKKLFNNLEVIR
jgi:hypothetical protein